MKRTFTADENWIDLIGEIWQPGCGTCAQNITLSPYDVKNIGEPTRENVRAWIHMNVGDFQSVIDFHAVVGETDLPWADLENEMVFLIVCTRNE